MPTTVQSHDGYLRKLLGNQEEILFVVRRHGIFLFWHIFLWLLLAAAIFVGVTWSAILNPNASIAYLALIVPLVPIWWTWLEWSNHKFIVTNRRVLQMRGVFGKHVVDAQLDQINDVKTDQTLFGRIFNYGDVEVVTASDILSDQMTKVARPLDFKRVLTDAKDRLLHHNGA